MSAGPASPSLHLWELVRPGAESTKGGVQLSSRWLLSDPMRTFAQSRHCAITGLAEGCDFGRKTSVARTVNHARGSCGRLPTSRPVHDLGCAVPAAPQCGREVYVGPLPVGACHHRGLLPPTALGSA